MPLLAVLLAVDDGHRGSARDAAAIVFVLASITVFIIERDFLKAAAFAAAGAVFTFFGLIHAEALGIGQTPSMVVSYLGIAAILLACAKYAGLAPLPGEASRMHGHGEPAAKPAE